ncbi:MAG: aminoacyl-tRNA hydrolase [Betaproteobacteria bacterium]|nr:aminoacyl-tRNA hydrolase [Betaproteobacteria bacterium]NBT10816.1 aminoacyl-tRNA hydrolase [Betaproteobacteria bacterium]NBU48782.1 aminoacyl-tRNA hydrolase [Betaproteobacteria bacterium]
MPSIAFHLSPQELEFSAIRAQGAGGQNVNKVSNAVMLRFDVRASSLPDLLKSRVMALGDQRVSREGMVVIKAQEHRSLPMNREAAIRRLLELLEQAAHIPATRRTTRPTRRSVRQRLDAKAIRARTKALRARVGQGRRDV